MLQERHLTDHVQLRLLTSSCGCWRLPAQSTVASECSRKSSFVVLQQDRAEVKRVTCLPAKRLTQAGVSQRPQLQ